MAKFDIKFALEKETPGAVRYMEVNSDGDKVTNADGAKIGSLYIRKDALKGTVPKGLRVTIITE